MGSGEKGIVWVKSKLFGMSWLVQPNDEKGMRVEGEVDRQGPAGRLIDRFELLLLNLLILHCNQTGLHCTAVEEPGLENASNSKDNHRSAPAQSNLRSHQIHLRCSE